ncbi:conserved repeat domain-containing protein [Solilutibacter tolerans]|uniref:Conserved repeat domain-containing protein n=2 Tax=Solilutibacter tolerans TaxID=1604334 RepID=A0A1N6Y2J4_9GAMM|nr:conserved repeat domain-containing protein [Lysobacter tolerans]
MFLAQGSPTTLSNVNTNQNPLTFPSVGTAGIAYNAVAFNPLDNYLYAIQVNTTNLIRISSTGAVTNLGAVPNLPTGNNYIAGEISPSGVFYVKSGTNGTQIHRINLSPNPDTAAATTISLSQDIGNIPDLTWSGGYLYGRKFNGAAGVPEQLYRIDPATGNAIAIGPAVNDDIAFGGLIGAPNGVYGFANNGSGFYEFNLTTGGFALISGAPGSSNNDAAHCTSENVTFGADLSISKTDGATTYVPGNVVYTIVVRNSGPFGAAGNLVSDPLPSGITSATWTCGSATNGAACGSPSGNGAINDSGLDLPANSQVTYTLTLQVPASFTGDLTNIAGVTPGDSTIDTNASNNSATDTDTLASGSATTYSLTVTNAGPGPANGSTLRDQPGTGLNCTTASCTSTTGAAACPTQTGAALYSALTSANGVTLPTLPSGGTVTITVSCTAP